MAAEQPIKRHAFAILVRPGAQPFDAEINHKLPWQYRFDLPQLQVLVLSAAPLPHAWLSMDSSADGSQVRFCSGLKISTDPHRAAGSGAYNEIIADGAQARMIVRTDFMAALPLYLTVNGDTLAAANSLRVLRALFHLPLNESAVAQWFLMAGWTVDERTLLEGVRTAAAGTEHIFDATRGWHLTETRTVSTWTGLTTNDIRQAAHESGRLWQQGVARTAQHSGGQVGLLLSGGLDSRMVAAGLAREGVDLVCLTHGNTDSGEAQIARAVAGAIGAPWVANPMDDRFPFDALNVAALHEELDLVFNPVWDRSGQMLAARGIRTFATGSALEGLWGGEKVRRLVRRFLLNVAGPMLPAQTERPLAPPDIDTIAAVFAARARKRHYYYAELLRPYFRELAGAWAEALHETVRDILIRMAGHGQPTARQLHERFEHEQECRKIYSTQELVLARYGRVILPSHDLDFVEYVTNLPAMLKYDHRLYYRVIRDIYPDMAAIPVPNLGAPVNRSQLSVELTRAWSVASKRRPTSWVNFEAWMAIADNLDQYERLFLACDHFFEPDRIRAYFNEVRAGRRRLYDGNETLSFLSLARFVQPHEVTGSDLLSAADGGAQAFAISAASST